MYSSSISSQELNALPKAAFTGEIVVLDKLGKSFDEAVAYLSTQKVLGFDTESRPCFSPDQPHYGVSLLQLSGSEQAFLFRQNPQRSGRDHPDAGLFRPLRHVLCLCLCKARA